MADTPDNQDPKLSTRDTQRLPKLPEESSQEPRTGKPPRINTPFAASGPFAGVSAHPIGGTGSAFRRAVIPSGSAPVRRAGDVSLEGHVDNTDDGGGADELSEVRVAGEGSLPQAGDSGVYNTGVLQSVDVASASQRAPSLAKAYGTLRDKFNTLRGRTVIIGLFAAALGFMGGALAGKYLVENKIKSSGGVPDQKTIDTAVKEAMKGHVSGWESSLRANKGVMHITGFSPYAFENKISVEIPVQGYFEMKSMQRSASKPSDYAALASAEAPYAAVLSDAVKQIALSHQGKPFKGDIENRAQLLFDFIRIQMRMDNVPSQRVKHPLETLADMGGTHADLSVMSAQMLKLLGMDTAIMYFPAQGELPERVVACVAGDFSEDNPHVSRVSYNIGGKKFYAFDPSVEGSGDNRFSIGEAHPSLATRQARIYLVK